MYKKLSNVFNVSLSTVLIFQLIGCGTILYPERKGQTSGKIDAGVAILDGIGLLFFLIPGVIAFAVDFNNGTIYLPGTSRSSLNIQDIREVKFDPKRNNRVDIEQMIKDQTGYTVKLDESSAKITELKSIEDMKEQFARISISGMQDERIAYVR